MDKKMCGHFFTASSFLHECWTAAWVLKRQVLNRSEQLLVTGLSVNTGSQNRLVSGKTLHKPYVPGPAIQNSAACVPQTMQTEDPIESGTYLPLSKSMSKLPAAEPVSFTTNKKRCVQIHPLPLPLLPIIELIQLETKYFWKDDLLLGGILAASFKHSKLNVAFRSA